jgi:4-hydroxy-tetrahydrodipicolinate reductase
MTLSVCVAGATGWTGRAVAQGVLDADDLRLLSGVSRSSAGADLGAAWGVEQLGVPLLGSVVEALDRLDGDGRRADVLVDYTSHDSVLEHVLAAVERGVHVVVGTSGLTADEFVRIDDAARTAGVGVVAAGNFSLTAAMAAAASLLVAPYLPQREIVDYASAGKPDVPSGTARELAERLGDVSRPTLDVSLADTSGPVEARGATVGGTQVHSVRLPSFVVSTEVVFAAPDERLVIRHDAGPTPTPYVAGTLLAVRRSVQQVGLVRGLDRLLLGG